MGKEARNRQIEKLFYELHDRLRAIALASLGETLAEDAVQETFVIACRSYDALSSSPNPQGGLVNTLKHVIMKTMRAQSREARNTAPPPAGEDGPAEERFPSVSDEYTFELEDAFVRAVGRDAYILYRELYLLGLPIEEVARRHGLTEDACRNRAYRTRKKLKKFFEDGQDF